MSEFLERHKAQFLTGAYKFIETAGKTATMFEGAQQHIGDTGADDLHRQGILTFPDRALDLEHLLDPLPPLLNRPSLYYTTAPRSARSDQSGRSRPGSTCHRATDYLTPASPYYRHICRCIRRHA